jgi:hypothetical protein
VADAKALREPRQGNGKLGFSHFPSILGQKNLRRKLPFERK